MRTLNFNRGLKGAAESLVRMLPHGNAILEHGAREIIHKAIDNHPDISKRDFTAVEIAEEIGILPKSQPEPKRVKRGRA